MLYRTRRDVRASAGGPIAVAEPSPYDSALAYDLWFDSPWGRYASGIEWRALAGELGRLSGAQVLDVGCGSGRFMRRLEEAGAHVVGVDVGAGMLEVARTRVRGPLLRADAHRLPFADAAFDVSMAVTVLEFVREPRRALEEMARATRPAGRVVIGALSPTSPWGLAHRRRLGASPWTGVRFHSRSRLLSLGGTIGRAHVHGVLLAPGAFPGLTVVGPILETAGAVFQALGAFQVLTVEVPR